MSNSDFEDRLRRINSGNTRQSGAPSGGQEKKGIRYGRLVLGALAMSAGGQTIKIANSNYDSIRDQYGIPAALGLGLGSFVLLIVGCVLLVGAVLPARTTASVQAPLSSSTRVTEPKAQTTAGARLFFSLFGLGLGGLACFFLFVGSAPGTPQYADRIDTQTAHAIFAGSFIVASFLGTLAFLTGIIGLFVRRLPMRRVPVFFVLGAMVLFTSFQTLRIHPANWPTFMAEFTRSFTNQIAE